MSDDFIVITSYFNPCRYRTKRQNFEVFEEGLRAAGAKLLVVELAFEDEPFELETRAPVLRLRGGSVLWQKERLLNLAIASLPASCRKVAWLDCDLVFEDALWLQNTSAALDEFVVVQPFDTIVRLPRGHTSYQGSGETYEAFASAYARAPLAAHGCDFQAHGHTGFAWAARRSLLDAWGLYDACLTGSGDHLMAHAFAGAARSPCVTSMIGMSNRYCEHFLAWADGVANAIGGRLGAVPGRLLHLWHGELEDRRYHLRNQQFKTFDFDPTSDLRIDEAGLWAWANAPVSMRTWAHRIFFLRNEDGDLIFRSRRRIE